MIEFCQRFTSDSIMPNQFTTRRVEIYLHFEVGGKVHFRPNGEREWRKAEVLPRSHLVENEHGLAYWRNRRHIITAPNNLSMIPRPSGPPTSSQPWDPPVSSLTLTPEGQVPSPLKLTETNRNRFKHTHFNQIWATNQQVTATRWILLEGNVVTLNVWVPP